ncbi:MAG: TetR/AcrR family transcriptional regulator C-terminal ligand-binding domain-containing protein [Actinomycetota bacterium]
MRHNVSQQRDVDPWQTWQVTSEDRGVAVPKPADARAARSQAAMLEAGIHLLATVGWSQITQQRVAEVAGVGRATAYRHWPEQSALLADILQHALASEAYAVTHVGDTRVDLIAELHALATAMNDGLTYDIVVTLIQQSGASDELGALNGRLSRVARRGIWRVVRRATARDELRSGIDETQVAAQLIGPLAYRRLLMSERIEMHHIESTVDAFLTHAQTAASS